MLLYRPNYISMKFCDMSCKDGMHFIFVQIKRILQVDANPFDMLFVSYV